MASKQPPTDSKKKQKPPTELERLLAEMEQLHETPVKSHNIDLDVATGHGQPTIVLALDFSGSMCTSVYVLLCILYWMQALCKQLQIACFVLPFGWRDPTNAPAAMEIGQFMAYLATTTTRMLVTVGKTNAYQALYELVNNSTYIDALTVFGKSVFMHHTLVAVSDGAFTDAKGHEIAGFAERAARSFHVLLLPSKVSELDFPWAMVCATFTCMINGPRLREEDVLMCSKHELPKSVCMQSILQHIRRCPAILSFLVNVCVATRATAVVAASAPAEMAKAVDLYEKVKTGIHDAILADVDMADFVKYLTALLSLPSIQIDADMAGFVKNLAALLGLPSSQIGEGRGMYITPLIKILEAKRLELLKKNLWGDLVVKMPPEWQHLFVPNMEAILTACGRIPGNIAAQIERHHASASEATVAEVASLCQNLCGAECSPAAANELVAKIKQQLVLLPSPAKEPNPYRLVFPLDKNDAPADVERIEQWAQDVECIEDWVNKHAELFFKHTMYVVYGPVLAPYNFDVQGCLRNRYSGLPLTVQEVLRDRLRKNLGLLEAYNASYKLCTEQHPTIDLRGALIHPSGRYGGLVPIIKDSELEKQWIRTTNDLGIKIGAAGREADAAAKLAAAQAKVEKAKAEECLRQARLKQQQADEARRLADVDRQRAVAQEADANLKLARLQQQQDEPVAEKAAAQHAAYLGAAYTPRRRQTKADRLAARKQKQDEMDRLAAAADEANALLQQKQEEVAAEATAPLQQQHGTPLSGFFGGEMGDEPVTVRQFKLPKVAVGDHANDVGRWLFKMQAGLSEVEATSLKEAISLATDGKLDGNASTLYLLVTLALLGEGDAETKADIRTYVNKPGVIKSLLDWLTVSRSSSGSSRSLSPVMSVPVIRMLLGLNITVQTLPESVAALMRAAGAADNTVSAIKSHEHNGNIVVKRAETVCAMAGSRVMTVPGHYTDVPSGPWAGSNPVEIKLVRLESKILHNGGWPDLVITASRGGQCLCVWPEHTLSDQDVSLAEKLAVLVAEAKKQKTDKTGHVQLSGRLSCLIQNSLAELDKVPIDTGKAAARITLVSDAQVTERFHGSPLSKGERALAASASCTYVLGEAPPSTSIMELGQLCTHEKGKCPTWCFSTIGAIRAGLYGVFNDSKMACVMRYMRVLHCATRLIGHGSKADLEAEQWFKYAAGSAAEIEKARADYARYRADADYSVPEPVLAEIIRTVFETLPVKTEARCVEQVYLLPRQFVYDAAPDPLVREMLRRGQSAIVGDTSMLVVDIGTNETSLLLTEASLPADGVTVEASPPPANETSLPPAEASLPADETSLPPADGAVIPPPAGFEGAAVVQAPEVDVGALPPPAEAVMQAQVDDVETPPPPPDAPTPQQREWITYFYCNL